jgi:hypothetical protein
MWQRATVAVSILSQEDKTKSQLEAAYINTREYFFKTKAGEGAIYIINI